MRSRGRLTVRRAGASLQAGFPAQIPGSKGREFLRNLRLRYGIIALAFATWAPWASASTSASATNGCGTGAPRYSVVTDRAVLGGAPKSDQARIVIFQAGDPVSATQQVFRVRVDGRWTGALRNYSWQLFPVAPGLHHVCVQWESPLKSLASRTATALVTTHPGRTSWLELSVAGSAGSVSSFYLFGVRASEGSAVAASLPHSVATAGK